MPKMIFLDIDGTLCEPGKQVSEITVRALHQAQKNGHKIFISTGRNIPTIQPFVLDIGFDGIIASAGSYITVEGKVLKDKKMPKELLEHARSVFDRYDISYMMETSTGTYADIDRFFSVWRRNLSAANSEIRRIIELLKGLGIQPIEKFSDQQVYKIGFIGKTEEAVLAAFEELGEAFDTVFHENQIPGEPRINGETMAKGADKGTGIKQICEYYGVNLEDTIAFGDSGNDLPMLAVAGTAVVMGNAAPGVKACADVICESCAEDGIAHQLERMGLI